MQDLKLDQRKDPFNSSRCNKHPQERLIPESSNGVGSVPPRSHCVFSYLSSPAFVR